MSVAVRAIGRTSGRSSSREPTEEWGAVQLDGPLMSFKSGQDSRVVGENK